jgi:hypothetical protein
MPRLQGVSRGRGSRWVYRTPKATRMRSAQTKWGVACADTHPNSTELAQPGSNSHRQSSFWPESGPQTDSNPRLSCATASRPSPLHASCCKVVLLGVLVLQQAAITLPIVNRLFSDCKCKLAQTCTTSQLPRTQCGHRHCELLMHTCRRTLLSKHACHYIQRPPLGCQNFSGRCRDALQWVPSTRRYLTLPHCHVAVCSFQVM